MLRRGTSTRSARATRRRSYDAAMPEPIVSRPGEGEMHKRVDGYRLIRADLEHIGAIEIDFDETLVVPPHTHADHTDSFFVLEGEVEFTAGDETVVLGPGGFISSCSIPHSPAAIV